MSCAPESVSSQASIAATDCSPVAVMLGGSLPPPSSDFREDGVPRVLRVSERVSELSMWV